MDTPTTVNTTVFSLAGASFKAPPTQPAATFSDPVPLGVRLFSVVDAGERWVTRWVDDITFRSVVPGGFASATITLRVPRSAGAVARPDPLGFSRMVELFERIQIVDLRSLEVAWEGRVEDPARQVDPDTWQIGALGSMVAATDIQRPVLYADSSLDRWTPGYRLDETGTFLTVFRIDFDTSKDTSTNILTITYNTNGGITTNRRYSWRWDSHGYDQPIARFTTSHQGSISATGENANTVVLLGINANPEIDVTAYSSSAYTTKANVIGTDFTDANTRFIVFGTRRVTGAAGYLPAAGDVVKLLLRDPKVLGMRQNRFGTKLTTAASYPGDYVTVSQVVEDVVGRFLVGGWYEGGINTPWPGSVRPQDVYIDASNTTQILHLTYPDGATAADILNDLIDQVQPNAYWALWESAWGAGTPNTSFSSGSGFRFEFATWPNNWGYLASSQDGFEGQPSGDDVYNFIFYRFPHSGDANVYHASTSWRGDNMAPELYNGGFTRAITINKTDPTDDPTANSLAQATLDSKAKVLNAGTLTVKRPIQLYDAGKNSNSGAGRMVDPWMIRPGKLIRITDLPPRSGSTDTAYGSTAPSSALNGTVFKVVATEYQSSDNSCRLELDQVSTWRVPTQIHKVSGPPKTIRIQ